MPRSRILPALLLLAITVCFASSADARRRHHGYYGYGERAPPARSPNGRPRHAQPAKTNNLRAATTLATPSAQKPRCPAAGAVCSPPRSRSSCAAALRRAPSSRIGRLMRFRAASAPTRLQNKALDGLREGAKQAAQRLAADCPQEVSAAPPVRLEAAEQGIAATLAAYDIIEPKLAAFYGALSDEQKARLYRDTAASAASSPTPRRRRARTRVGPNTANAIPRAGIFGAIMGKRVKLLPANPPRRAAAPGFTRMCEELGAVLRNWPMREIELNVRLSDAQRVAFYEFVTTSLKAAETLSSACPAEAALTPTGRMETMRKRLAAVRAATAAIRPALAHFYEALDQEQKVRFLGMS